VLYQTYLLFLKKKCTDQVKTSEELITPAKRDRQPKTITKKARE